MILERHRCGVLICTGARDMNEIMRADVDYFWSLRPNLHNYEVTEMRACAEEGRSTTYRYSTNELGMRGPSVLSRKPALRILALGDSTTFGQHLADHDAWPAQLQQLLDPERKKVEVLNAGLIGASSFQGLSYLASRGIDLDPDVVIVTYGFNDYAQAPLSDRVRARLNRQRGLRGLLSMLLTDAHEAKDKTALTQRATPGEYLDHLIAIQTLCAEHDIATIFVVWPGEGDVLQAQDIAFHQLLIMEASRSTGAHYVNLLPPFQEAPGPTHMDCIHGTVLGCTIAAERLAQEIQTLFPDIVEY